jgi:hypothetical protein
MAKLAMNKPNCDLLLFGKKRKTERTKRWPANGPIDKTVTSLALSKYITDDLVV